MVFPPVTCPSALTRLLPQSAGERSERPRPAPRRKIPWHKGRQSLAPARAPCPDGTSPQEPAAIRTRDVFFVHGFEKRSPRHHRLAQRREAARWSQVTGTPLTITPIEEERPGYARWRLVTAKSETRFHLFDWSDLIAARMKAPWWRAAAEGAASLTCALGQGFFGKIRRRDWALWLMLMTGFAPLALTIILALAALATLSATLALLTALAAVLTARALAAGPRSPIRYVLDIAHGARRLACRDHPELERRRAALRARVAAAPGPVLLVGHSLGATIALTAAAGQSRTDLSLLTIGQSIPLVALQREADATRAALHDITCPWVDISAGRDVLGFDGYDPTDSGRAQCYPARLSRAIPPERLKRLRWRGYATHLLYFDAPRVAGLPWDWFEILTGPDTPQQRLAGERRKDGKGGRRFLF